MTKTVAKRSITELIKFSVLTGIVPPVNERAINHGTPRPKRMSKMFEPIAFEIAMSPRPCFATMTEDIVSGIDVPIARTVSAMMASGMFKMCDTWIALSTSPQLSAAIIIIDRAKTM